MPILQVIAQEILTQLKQNLQQAGLTYTETPDSIDYIDKNQRSTKINNQYLSHQGIPIGHQGIPKIQIQKWKNEPRSSGWHTQADIIIDQQSIIIYSRMTPTITYELTDPHAIQDAIQTITQKL